MALDRESLEILARALDKLDVGFARLPDFASGVPGGARTEEVMLALAQTNLLAAKASFTNKQNQVSSDVRRKTRRVRETDAGKEVARLELQLVQQDLAQLQARFEEGKESLQVVEKARLDENEKWMALLDASFQRQQAQLDLLKTAGQLDKVLQ